MPLNPNMPEPGVSNPCGDIAKFLADNETVPERRLAVAMALARSMLQELETTLAQWQEVERQLEQIKVAANN